MVHSTRVKGRGRLERLSRVISHEIRAPALNSIKEIPRVMLKLPFCVLVWARWQICGLNRPSVTFYLTREELLKDAASRAQNGGLWLEFGVYQGYSLNLISGETSGVVYGFDSFLGLPDGWLPSLPRGSFSTGGSVPRVEKNALLVNGRFEETLPKFLEVHPGEEISFMHIDCDLYESTRVVLEAVEGRIRAGAVIVFDEFISPIADDEFRAFRESCERTGNGFSYFGCSVTGSVGGIVRMRSDSESPRGSPGGQGVRVPDNTPPRSLHGDKSVEKTCAESVPAQLLGSPF